MPDLKIDADIRAALKALDIELSALVPVMGVAVAEAARNDVAPYPTQTGKAQPFVSAQQRRAFFAKLRSGAISVPYRRQGLIGRSWQVQAQPTGALLFNTARGVAFTTAAATQSGYHKGNWPTDEEAAKRAEQRGEVLTVAQEVLDDVVRKAGGAP